MTKWQHVLLWASLAIYVGARVCQLYANRLPTLLIVILHVVPPAIFAFIHGSILYRFRGMLVFIACCLGVGGLSESLSLRTHSMRKARTGSMEAARRAGMMPAMAAVSTSTPIAMAMTGTFTLVVS